MYSYSILAADKGVQVACTERSCTARGPDKIIMERSFVIRSEGLEIAMLHHAYRFHSGPVQD